MTVEHLTVSSEARGVDGVERLEFCVNHRSVLNALAEQRQMNSEQRETVMQTMLYGVVSMMGPSVFAQHGGCPVCVLEGTLERACDEVSMIGRKAS